MKKYEKPYIDEEIIEIEDVIAASQGGETEEGIKIPFPFDENE